MQVQWIKFSISGFGALALLVVLMLLPLQAQGVDGGLKNSKSPVDIEADVLEIDETKNTAVFTGNVIAKQDNSKLLATELVVFYAKKEGGGTDVKSMDAKGGVVIFTRTQKITGSWARFDLVADTVTVGGDVVVTQGRNVIRGRRLLVDQKTGKTRFISQAGGKKTRVRGLFTPPPKDGN